MSDFLGGGRASWESTVRALGVLMQVQTKASGLKKKQSTENY